MATLTDFSTTATRVRQAQITRRRRSAIRLTSQHNAQIQNYLLKNDNQSITLTEREASLLKLFLDNPNTVLKREKILMELWGSDDYFLGRSLDVFISRLRKIIKEETHVRIENIPRVGFKLVVE